MEEENVQITRGDDLIAAQEKKTAKLRQGIIEYGKSHKFLIFFMLTLLSSLITLTSSIIVLAGGSSIDIYQQKVSQIPLPLLLAFGMIGLVIPLLGLSMIYFGSKNKNHERLYSGLLTMSIYFYILLGLLIITGIIIAGMLFMLLTVNVVSAFVIGLIIGLIFLFYYKLLTKTTTMLNDLMDIVDQDKQRSYVKQANFESIRNYLIFIFVILIISFFTDSGSSLNSGDMTYSPIIILFGPDHMMVHLFSILNIAVLAYTIFMMDDLNKHMSLYDSVE